VWVVLEWASFFIGNTNFLLTVANMFNTRCDYYKNTTFTTVPGTAVQYSMKSTDKNGLNCTNSQWPHRQQDLTYYGTVLRYQYETPRNFDHWRFHNGTSTGTVVLVPNSCSYENHAPTRYWSTRSTGSLLVYYSTRPSMEQTTNSCVSWFVELTPKIDAFIGLSTSPFCLPYLLICCERNIALVY